MGGALRIARILMLSIVLVGGAYGQTVVVDFDNPQPPGSSFSLLNQHAGIDWQNAWRWEGPYGPSDSNHIFFHNGNGTSRTFGFQSGPRVLEAIDVFAMANGSLTLSDDQGQLLTQALSPGAVITVPTGWVQPSTVVTVAFTGGWDLGVDNITHRPAGGPQYQLTVSMTGAGQGTVTSAPAGIDCGNSCNALFNDSTNVVLTPVASAGSEFIGWSGPADCADGNVTVSVELACVAQFSLLAPTEYPLTVTLAGGGSGTVTSNPTGIDCGQTCQEQYADGTPVTLAAVAAAGSQFDGWSGDADCSDASVIVDRAVNCVASFSTIVPAPAFDLSVSLAGAGTGSIASIPAGIACPGQCTAEFDEDAAVSLAASADPGSQFDGWSGAPACAVGNIVMVADTSCVATFSLLPPQNLLSITIAGGGGGTVESDIPGIDCGSICQAQYPLGTVVTLTATPDPASQFAGWSGDADCADGVVDLSVPVDCTADFALPGGGAGTALHFFGSGVSAPDRDRVKFLIDDYTTSSESGNALDIGDTD
ncbi:MAG: InlB B-repeat-containing protein, partial [Gammaproteobacteria bacterium]|nr:InlB B-repeat-containing protein [Gammaproteobacteria bacterium]